MTRGAVLIFLALSANFVFAQSTLPSGVTGSAVQLDSGGNIYIAGQYVANLQNQNALGKAYIAKLSPDGSTVLWQTILGGSGNDSAKALAIDSMNSVYVTGTAQSADFPTTPRSLQPASAGGQAFAATLDSAGNVIYATYIGGTATTTGQAIAVDSAGHAFITGALFGSGFHTSPGAAVGGAQTNSAGGTQFAMQVGFVIELDPAGATAPVAIAGFGGSAIAVDPQGYIYAVGSPVNPDFPTTAGAFQTSATAKLCDGGGLFFTVPVGCEFQHVAKIDPTGTKLIYGTYMDGTWGATTWGLAIDPRGDVILAGATSSPDYPTTPDSWQPAYVSNPAQQSSLTLFAAPPSAGYITKLNSTGTALLWSTFLAGVAMPPPDNLSQGDGIYSMTMDAAANIIVSGFTTSPTFPGLWNTPVADRPSNNRQLGFVARLSPGGTSLSPVQLFPKVFASIAAASGGSIIAIGTQIQTIALSPIGHVAAITDSADGAEIVSFAPGQLLTLYGTDLAPAAPAQPSGGFPTSFNGVAITFNGIPAPILYTAGDQINLQVPYEIAGQPQAAMQMVSQSAVAPFTESYILGVAANQPSVFLTAADFSGPLFGSISCNGVTMPGLQPLALNADGTLNSCANPAPANSTVTLFLNGMGDTSPAQLTGAIVSTSAQLTPAAALNGANVPVTILSTATVPGAISSLAEVQIQISTTSSVAIPTTVAGILAREQNIIVRIQP